MPKLVCSSCKAVKQADKKRYRRHKDNPAYLCRNCRVIKKQSVPVTPASTEQPQ